MNKPITKAELIALLQDDKTPMDAPVSLYLQCSNRDVCIVGTVAGIAYIWNDLTIVGEYEEEE